MPNLQPLTDALTDLKAQFSETRRYGVRVIVGADIGHPVEGWARGGKSLTHETAVAVADGLRERGYTAFVKPYP